MVSIRQDGMQSFMLNDTKDFIIQGGAVTHILNVKISSERTHEEGNKIREKMFQAIANKPITYNFNDIDVTITWRTTATRTSAYYHADVGDLVNEETVHMHAHRMLVDVFMAMNPDVNFAFTEALNDKGPTGAALLITKPVAAEVLILADLMDL